MNDVPAALDCLLERLRLERLDRDLFLGAAPRAAWWPTRRVQGAMYNGEGARIVSVVQEGLIRTRRA